MTSSPAAPCFILRKLHKICLTHPEAARLLLRDAEHLPCTFAICGGDDRCMPGALPAICPGQPWATMVIMVHHVPSPFSRTLSSQIPLGPPAHKGNLDPGRTDVYL